jgi:hypothetical protein
LVVVHQIPATKLKKIPLVLVVAELTGLDPL